MTVLKFRVWNKRDKKMSPVAVLHFGMDGSGLTTMIQPAPQGPYMDQLVAAESGELMQWTGITDINGKDIYEGDIVHVRKPNSYLEGSYIVAWNVHHCQFAWKRIIPSPTGEEWAMMGANRPYSLNQRDKAVIGNVYENPGMIGE